MNPTEFLHALWGPTPPGCVQLWDIATKRSSYIGAPAQAGGAAGRPDVYTAVGTSPTILDTGRRCPADQIHAITGMWLDLDINGGPERRTQRAPDWDAAEKLAHHFADPTIVVNSGYGMQAWWLLETPWILDDESRPAAAQLARQWQRAHAEVAGFKIDAAHDLARLLRLPGTINAKGGHGVRVTVEAVDLSLRYSRRELVDLVGHVDGSDYASRPTTGGPGSGPPAAIAVPAGPLSDDARTILELALEVDPELRATWYRERKLRGDDSQSAWDLSFASRLASLAPDIEDQPFAELISAFRSRMPGGDTKGKAGRVDYLARTIGTARRQGAHDVLARQASHYATEAREAARRRAGV